MSSFDAESYASYWRKRNKKEEERIAVRMQAALDEAKRIAGRFKREADVEKVVLFGSLAENSMRNEQFDIDLAVWGGDWKKVLEIAEESESGFDVDIVEYKNLPEHIRKRIDTRGKMM
jgi:predicted nucleotidyltransferase